MYFLRKPRIFNRRHICKREHEIIAQYLIWTDTNTIFENPVLHYLDQYLFESLVRWAIKYALDRIMINSGFLQHKCATFYLLEGQQQFGTVVTSLNISTLHVKREKWVS